MLNLLTLTAVLVGGLIFLPVLAWPALAEGQVKVHWTRSQRAAANLPFSIELYLTQDSVHGRPFRAAYVIADPDDLKLDLTVEAGTKTPAEYFAGLTPSPFVVVNGGEGLLLREGKLLTHAKIALRSPGDSVYHYVTPSALGITVTRKVDVGWVFTDSTRDYPLVMMKGPSDPRRSKGPHSNPGILEIHSENVNSEIGAQTMHWPVETALGGGPTIVKRGQVFISSREEVTFYGHEDELMARTAMGYTRDNKLIILVIESGHPGQSTGATLLEEASIMHDLGCWEALNMGGGPNTCLLVNGQSILRPDTPDGAERAPGVVFVIKSHL